IDGGDMMHASELVATNENSRDASYVRYQLLVDKYAAQRRRTQSLCRGFLRPTPPHLSRNDMASTLLLAAIQLAKTEQASDVQCIFYKDDGALDVVDLASVQCVIGRVYDEQRKQYGIIDRSGPLARAVFVNDS
ncbi:hypothetical protein B0H21DRAFT_695506, partial [Amylocystis lapponica]